MSTTRTLMTTGLEVGDPQDAERRAATLLYRHQTDGGAEYLCSKHINGCDEGDLSFAVVRLDGRPELLGVYRAAPVMLAALRELERGIRLWISEGVSDEALTRAQAAIRAATGEA